MADKDCVPEGANPALLEEILAVEAQKATMQAYLYENPMVYVQALMDYEARKYRNTRAVSLHLTNFLVDSYIYWRRHNHHTDAHECSPSEAQWLAIRDTLEYVGRLHNDYPMQNRPMTSDWRTGEVIRKTRRKK